MRWSSLIAIKNCHYSERWAWSLDNILVRLSPLWYHLRRTCEVDLSVQMWWRWLNVDVLLNIHWPNHLCRITKYWTHLFLMRTLVERKDYSRDVWIMSSLLIHPNRSLLRRDRDFVNDYIVENVHRWWK